MKMNLETFLELLRAGWILWVDPPKNIELEIDDGYEERYRGVRELFSNLPPRLGSSTLLPPTKRIHVKYPHTLETLDENGQTVSRKDYQYCTIAINLKREMVDYGESDSWLFGKGHMGSGAIGVAIFTAPFAILCLPLIIAANIRYNQQEKETGMSRHDYAVLQALKGKLDKETEALLERAMRNSWKHQQEMRRSVTLPEAKTLLSECRLRISSGNARTSEDSINRPWQSFYWWKGDDADGDLIANGSFFDSRGEHYIRVLGSRFEGKEADELIKYYKVLEHTEDSDEMD